MSWMAAPVIWLVGWTTTRRLTHITLSTKTETKPRSCETMTIVMRRFNSLVLSAAILALTGMAQARVVAQETLTGLAKKAEVLFTDYIAEHLTPEGRAGVIVPIMQHAAKPILEHMEDYLSDLAGQNLAADHIRNVRSRLTEVIRIGDWKRLADIDADGMRLLAGPAGWCSGSCTAWPGARFRGAGIRR